MCNEPSDGCSKPQSVMARSNSGRSNNSRKPELCTPTYVSLCVQRNAARVSVSNVRFAPLNQKTSPTWRRCKTHCGDKKNCSFAAKQIKQSYKNRFSGLTTMIYGASVTKASNQRVNSTILLDKDIASSATAIATRKHKITVLTCLQPFCLSLFRHRQRFRRRYRTRRVFQCLRRLWRTCC